MMRKVYEKPSLEVNEYNIEETITISSIFANLFGEDILEDDDALEWEWVD